MLKKLFVLTLLTSWGVGAENIRVLTENLPPYQITENGQVVAGSSYFIMKEVLKRANIEAAHEVIPWARAYKTATDRQNTIIYSITRSQEREPFLKWIGRLHDSKYSFFSTKTNKNINIESSIDALNYTAVSIRSSFEASSLKRFGFEEGKNLMLVVDWTSAWTMLQMGRADVIYADDYVLMANGFDGALFQKQGPTIETFELYVAANLNTNIQILKRLKAALESVRKDPLFKGLFEH